VSLDGGGEFPEFAAVPLAVSVARPRTDAKTDSDDDENNSQQSPVHRTFFPETWLWSLERMRSVGYWVVSKVCSDWPT